MDTVLQEITARDGHLCSVSDQVGRTICKARSIVETSTCATLPNQAMHPDGGFAAAGDRPNRYTNYPCYAKNTPYPLAGKTHDE